MKETFKFQENDKVVLLCPDSMKGLMGTITSRKVLDRTPNNYYHIKLDESYSYNLLTYCHEILNVGREENEIEKVLHFT